MVQKVLYIKIDKHVLCDRATVRLGDIARMTGLEQRELEEIKRILICEFEKGQSKSQYKSWSVLKVVEKIRMQERDLIIQNEGESDFILEYQGKQEKAGTQIVKMIALCVIIFLGSAFTIMAFHNDIGLNKMFSNLYGQVMGREKEGFTLMEAGYVIGMVSSICLFFNHMGRKYSRNDPTPLQVEMRKYEADLTETIQENMTREGKNIDVDQTD